MEFIDDLEERIATPGKLAGLDFGSNFKRLTQATGGLREKIVMTLASAQGKGKSALAASLALGLSYEKKVPGLFISVEMTRKQIVTRNIAMLAGVPLEAIEGGSLTKEEGDRIAD